MTDSRTLDELLSMLKKLDAWMVEHDRHIETRTIGLP